MRARYEKELRGLHEDKNRSEEEIRQQLRDEKVSTRKKEEEKAELMSLSVSLRKLLCCVFVLRPVPKSWRASSCGWRSCRLRWCPWREPRAGSRGDSRRPRSVRSAPSQPQRPRPTVSNYWKWSLVASRGQCLVNHFYSSLHVLKYLVCKICKKAHLTGGRYLLLCLHSNIYQNYLKSMQNIFRQNKLAELYTYVFVSVI